MIFEHRKEGVLLNHLHSRTAKNDIVVNVIKKQSPAERRAVAALIASGTPEDTIVVRSLAALVTIYEFSRVARDRGAGWAVSTAKSRDRLARREANGRCAC